MYTQFILDIKTDSQRDKIIAAKDTIVNNVAGAYDAIILDSSPTSIRNDDRTILSIVDINFDDDKPFIATSASS